MKKQLLWLIVAIATLVSCGGGSPTRPPQGGGEGEVVDSITFKYARLIHIEQHDGYQLATVDNPWKPGKVLHRYVLVPYGATQSNYTEQGATVVRIPLQRSIIFTSVHAVVDSSYHALCQLAAEAGKGRSVLVDKQTGSVWYVPGGQSTIGRMLVDAGADVNVAVGDSTSGVFHAQTFRLVDGQDYCVPYDVTADNVENTRTLAKSPVPYTVCLPYALDIPAGAKVYRLSGRGSNELIFAQHTGRMEAMQPYLVWTENSDALLSTVNVTLPASKGGTVGSQQQVLGYTLRGTLNGIGNQEAVELGAYVMNDDAKWHPVLSDTDEHRAVTIPAFRCFLLQSRYNSRTAIGMTLEDAEDIEQLRTIDSDGTERVYDLSGRRVDGSAKGIVIKNGRKRLSP